MKTRAWCFLVVVLGSGCATNVCNQKSARTLGKKDAAAWDGERSGLARGNACKGNYGRAAFEDDYGAAYARVLRQQCTRDAAWRLGQAAVEDEDHGVARREVLNLCADVEAPVAQLQDDYVAGVQSVLCEERRVALRGMRRGEALHRQDLRWLAMCPREQSQRLEDLYVRNHAAGVAQSCSPVSASQRGLNAARSGQEPDSELSLLRRCPAEMQPGALRAYQDAYYAEEQRQAAHREEEARRAERQRREDARRQRDAMLARQYAQANQLRFIVKDKELTVTCNVEDGHAVLEVINPHRVYVSFSGAFQVEVYNSLGQMVHASTENEFVNLGWQSRDTNRVLGYLPRDAATCAVRRVVVR